MGGNQSRTTLIEKSQESKNRNAPACELIVPTTDQAVLIYPIFVTFDQGQYNAITYGQDQFSPFAFKLTETILQDLGDTMNEGKPPSICRAFVMFITHMFNNKITMSDDDSTSSSLYNQLRQRIDDEMITPNKTKLARAQELFTNWKSTELLSKEDKKEGVSGIRLDILALTSLFKTDSEVGYGVVILTSFNAIFKRTLELVYLCCAKNEDDDTDRKKQMSDPVLEAEKEKMQILRNWAKHGIIQWPVATLTTVEETNFEAVDVNNLASKQLLGSALIGYQRLLASLSKELHKSDRLQKLMLFSPADKTELRELFTDQQESGTTRMVNRTFNTKDAIKRFLVYGSKNGETDNPAIKTAAKIGAMAAAAGVGAAIWSAYGDKIKDGISSLFSKKKKAATICPDLKIITSRLKDFKTLLVTDKERDQLNAIINDISKVTNELEQSNMSESEQNDIRDLEEPDSSYVDSHKEQDSNGENFELITDITDRKSPSDSLKKNITDPQKSSNDLKENMDQQKSSKELQTDMTDSKSSSNEIKTDTTDSKSSSYYTKTDITDSEVSGRDMSDSD